MKAKLTRRRPRLFAALSILAGVFLLTFEIRRIGQEGGFTLSFWLLVAILLIVLGMIELISSTRKSPPLS